jgi:hypothetical protein
MTNTFGNTVNVSLGCAFVAPPTGNTTTASLVLAALAVIGFAGIKSGKINFLSKLATMVRS